MGKCLLCGEEFIPNGTDPMRPVKEGNKVVFRYMHKECYNKEKEKKRD